MTYKINKYIEKEHQNNISKAHRGADMRSEVTDAALIPNLSTILEHASCFGK